MKKTSYFLVAVVLIAVAAGGAYWLEEEGFFSDTQPLVPVSEQKPYSLNEVAQHKTPADCWVAVNGGVYDLSNFAVKHPGGAPFIEALCGTDGTAAFTEQHGKDGEPKEVLDASKIGSLQIQ